MTVPSDASALALLPRTARNHLSLYFHEATLAVLYNLVARAESVGEDLDSVLQRFPFLRHYREELSARLPADIRWGEAFEWLRARTDEWESAAERGALPLVTLREEAALDRSCILTLVTIGLVEEEPGFAAVFATQNPGAHQSRPTIALLHQIALGANASADLDAWGHARPLLDMRLVEAMNPDAPRAECALRVPALIWSALRGETSAEPLPGVHRLHARDFRPLRELVLSRAQLERIIEMQVVLADGGARLLVVRGMPGSERLEIAGSVARSLGRGVLEVRDASVLSSDAGKLMGPLALLTHCLPTFVLELAAGETFEAPALAGYSGPIAAIIGRDGGLTGTASEQSLLVDLGPELVPERARHWAEALSEDGTRQTADFAERFMFGGRYIRQTARLAISLAGLDQRAQPNAEDVRLAARSINRQQLDSLAVRLDDGGSWAQLVLHPGTSAELRILEQRCRFRERLAQRMSDGVPGGMNRGVRALFEGPSGTGKTLAARILAAELGLDLYRIDLAAIVNKYIGETEKNLSRVLGRAEDLDVVLLLDEGDALMARRTDVRSANERYANLETNYLLQRLDGYMGIVVVTTNLSQHIDTAFQRRMDVVVKFHLPDPEQRLRLWQVHLPSDHTIPSDLLEEAAHRHPLTGGQIRNAAIAATLHSLGRSSPPGRYDLQHALEAEYRKAGAPPLAGYSAPTEINEHADPVEAMSVFLGAIS